MIKIGGVSIDVSHPLAFAQRLESEEFEMKYQFIAKESFRDDEEADWFARRFGATRVDRVEDMADKVDIGFIQSCNWDKHLDGAIPFLKAGKPVFIDKPAVGSVKDIKRLRALVKEGAEIYGGSCLRYVEEITNFLKTDAGERGEVIAIYATSGVDEFNYAVHVVEGMSTLAASPVAKGRFLSSSEIGGRRAESFSLTFENGVNAFYTAVYGAWYPFRMTVVTTTGVHVLPVGTADIYLPLLREIQAQLKTGKSALVGVEELINSTEAMLCLKKSRDFLQGAEVSLDMLDGDDAFDGAAFEAEYAASAKRIYQD